jgi:subtilisin family serine protease
LNWVGKKISVVAVVVVAITVLGVLRFHGPKNPWSTVNPPCVHASDKAGNARDCESGSSSADGTNSNPSPTGKKDSEETPKAESDKQASPAQPAHPDRTGSRERRINAPPAPEVSEFVPGQILIQYRSNASPGQKAEVRQIIGAELQERIADQDIKGSALGAAENTGGIEVVTLGGVSGAAVSKVNSAREREKLTSAISRIAQHPAVQYAEPNFVVTGSDEPNVSDDPRFMRGEMWGLYSDVPSTPNRPVSLYGIHADQAWMSGHTGSSQVYVAVIDSGVDISHPDLAANIWSNPYEANNGKDNDGNGLPGDVHGWNFLGNNNSVFRDGDHPHGTHIAGIIAAVGGNGVGVVGVNWRTTIIPVKFLGSDNTGTIANAVKAFNYVVDLKTRHNLHIIAINVSWTTYARSQFLLAAIKRAAAADILCVAAAGNEKNDNDGDKRAYPASFDTTKSEGADDPPEAFNSVLSVAAIQPDGALASFSNFGATSVDLGAPGVAILSTYPHGQYREMDGTSMAAPFVTGALALYASVHPSASAAEIKQRILDSALPTAALQGRTTTGGRLSVGKF